MPETPQPILWQRPNWRDELWAQLDQPWDIIVVGGGITGAGIMQQAARLRLRVLLVEQRDFAWGTSSRSSKMVHGGLRYLKDRNIHLTWESVRERQKLLKAGPGLIEELGFLIANYPGDRPGPMAYQAGLALYDMLGTEKRHRRYSAAEFQMMAPHIAQEGLQGGFRYGDAQTDDARLTLRVLQEGLAFGGTAINYVSADGLVRENGQVVGVRLCDQMKNRSAETRASVVISATGAWADQLRREINAPERIRPLRGSHLAFAGWRFPVAQAISFSHPFDYRPVFVFPWEGITLVGTTDVDHDAPLNAEPAISPEETAYLMAAVEDQFPSLRLTLDDVVSTWAGVRPVIDTGKADPSKESRDHAIWEENGLFTVTGGKLTTFRLMALDVLKAARHRLPALSALSDEAPPLQPVKVSLPPSLHPTIRRRLEGRYADQAPSLVATAQPGELEFIAGTYTLWAELRWAARTEAVMHLEDLLLRRTRLGLLLPDGGAAYMARIRQMCQPELGWSDARWEMETANYLTLWHKHYSLPERELIPDWRAGLAQVRAEREDVRSRKGQTSWLFFPLGVILALLILVRLSRSRRQPVSMKRV